MRQSPVRSYFADKNASFTESFGVEVVSCVQGEEKEYDFIRNSLGMTDFSFMQKYRVPEESGIDFLDSLFAGNVARIRFGRVLHTFLADDKGDIIADCYVANNDEEFIVLCESIVDDDTLNKIFDKHGAQDAGLENISDSYALIGIDGFQSWKLAKDLFTSDVLGLPYLSIETYEYNGKEMQVFRSGKTSEFGYLCLLPVEDALDFTRDCGEKIEKYEGGLCGVDIHNILRLEGRFFNIFAEGLIVKDPLPLGLQWMIDFDKEEFKGSDAILQRRDEGYTRKIVGIKIPGTCDAFKAETSLFDGSENVGTIITTCYSPLLDAMVGLALLPKDIAYSGIQLNLGEENGMVVDTISMPPIMPKSLTVKLDEM